MLTINQSYCHVVHVVQVLNSEHKVSAYGGEIGIILDTFIKSNPLLQVSGG